MILIPLFESITHSETDLKKKKSLGLCCSKLWARAKLCISEIWMWSCVTWYGLCSGLMRSSTGVPQHRKRPAKLSSAWQLQSAVGWLNNSKFLHRAIWQPKAGAPRHQPSSNSLCKSEWVWDEAAGPLHRQIELLTSKVKCAVSDWWLIWEDIGNQRGSSNIVDMT